MRKPLILSAVSGLFWGLLAFIAIPRDFGPPLWPGLAAAPLIGVMVGYATRDFANTSRLLRVGIALVSLYSAVAIYGLAIATAMGGLSTPERFYESVVVLWLGLTVSGLLLILWPLAFINLQLIWRVNGPRKPSSRLSATFAQPGL